MAPKPTGTGAAEIFAVAGFLVVLALFFAYRQWVERSRRGDELDPMDHDHYRRKDKRRFAGTAVMLIIASLMAASTRIPTTDKPAVRLWTWTWICVLLLLMALLCLAFADWSANTRYAARHRAALRAEQRDFWRDLANRLRRRHDRNGHS